MFNTNFELYLTIAFALGSSVSALPLSTEKILTISRRGSAVDAALSIEKATISLICSLSYQASAAVYALGIGGSPTPCIDSTTSAVVSTPITPFYRPTAARTRTPTALPTPPTSIKLDWTIPSTSSAITPVDMSHIVDSLPALIPSSFASPTTKTLSTVVTSSTSRAHICTSSDPKVCAFQAETLSTHNTARATIHHAKPLIWDDKLAEGAARWANVCQWKHSGGTIFPDIVYGEHLYTSTNNFPSSSMTEAVAAFMDEEAEYDYNKPDYSEAVGHFTQVVWKASSSVGCAAINCNLDVFSAYTNSSSYFVCLYFNSGNYLGEFADNVQAP